LICLKKQYRKGENDLALQNSKEEAYWRKPRMKRIIKQLAVSSSLLIALAGMLPGTVNGQSVSPNDETAPKAKQPAEKRAFQARIIVSPMSTGFQTEFLPIPAGKRLVIENISAIARCPEGFKMEINFFSYIDNNRDGVGDVSDIVFHRIALTDQGTFSGVAISSANHKVLVFADEQIGTGHFQVGVSARLNGTVTGNAQAQVTFTGYVEDLPVN
jgi:hypothetical protein